MCDKESGRLEVDDDGVVADLGVEQQDGGLCAGAFLVLLGVILLSGQRRV